MNTRKIKAKRLTRIFAVSASILLCFLIPIITPADASTNLITNGSFNGNLNSWTVRWSGNNNEFVYDSSFGYSGGAARADAVGETNNGLYEYDVPVESGATYRLSFYVYRDAAAASFPAYMDFNDGTVTLLEGGTNRGAVSYGTWEHCVISFRATSSVIAPRCVVEGITAGHVWFDEITMEKIEAAGDSGNLVTNGSFNSNLSNWDIRWSGRHDEFAIDSTFGYSGGSAKAVSNGTAENKGLYEYSVPTVSGATYQVSFYVYRNAAAQSYSSFSDINDGAVAIVSGKNSAQSYGQWEYCEYTFVAPSSSVAVRCAVVGMASGSVWFDELKMTRFTEASGNLVSNGSFVSSLSGWDIRWSGRHDEFAIDTTFGYSGASARAVSNGTAENKGLYEYSIPVDVGALYKVSFYVYRNAAAQSYSAFSDINDGTVAILSGTNSAQTYGQWEYCEYIFKATTSTVAPRCCVVGMASGSVWFDEFKLTKLSTPSRSLVVNGSFENGAGKPDNWNAGSAWTRVYAENGVTPTDGFTMLKAASTSTQICYGDAITVKANTYYNFTGKVYRTSSGGTAYMNLLNNNKTDIAGTQIGTDSVTGQWVTVSMTWYSGNNTSVYARCVIDNVSGSPLSGQPVYFDDVMLTEVGRDGNTAFPEAGTLGTVDASYELSNPSVTADFAVSNNKFYITSFSTGNTDCTEWITDPIEATLVNRINSMDVTWEYTSSSTDPITGGDKVTAVFTSTDGAFTLSATFTAMDSGGPIEYNQVISSSTKQISVRYSDCVSSNFRFDLDGDATLYRFSRSRVNDGSDPYFAQGTLTTALTNDVTVLSSTENGTSPTAGILPYEVIDVGGTHGVYFGYYWSFGKTLVRTDGYGNAAVTTYLDDSTDTIARSAGTSVEIPGFFMGAYEGDVDDGSNQMKSWFWDHKITRTIYNNADEPLIEADVCIGDADDFAEVTDIFENNNAEIQDYIQVIKIDYPWTVPAGTGAREDVATEDAWLPDTTTYPNGMNLWSAIKAYSSDLFLSLYMSDTYQGADIATEAGRNAEIAALVERFRPANNTYGVGFDYWRSDFTVEAIRDYDSHEGLLYILDSMIANYEDFRYEHCSGGGSLKDFTTLERMTFMTTEDTALPLNYRMSLYANTYMISPLQCKSDLNPMITTQTYGGITGTWIVCDNQGNPVEPWTSAEYMKYMLRTAMLGTPMVAFSRDCLAANVGLIEDTYALYQDVQRPILRDCDVYHVLAAPTGWSYNDWDGIEYYNHNIDKGVLMLFKENAAAPNSKTIKLDGLDANTMYQVTFIDRTAQNCVMSGSALMNTGLTVTGMTEEYDSEIVYIQPYTA